MEQRQCCAVVGDRAPRGGGEVAVRLVDQDQVGELDDALLEALELVAARRRQDQGEQVDEIGDRGLHWPTPTVSTITTSKPAASQTSPASRVRRATPPSVPPVGEGRMKRRGRARETGMRVLSPRIEPPGAGSTVDREHRDPVAGAIRYRPSPR